MSGSSDKKGRQRYIFPIRFPKPKPLPKLDHAEAATTIRLEWRRPDGTPITAADADHRASVFLHHLRFDPAPGWTPPKPRRRPERRTAERLRSFLTVETDRARR